MFDGIKIEIKDVVTHTRLLNNYLLDFTALHKATGEELTAAEKNENSRLTYKYAEYKGLKIKVYDGGRIEIKGSLHYYFNDGQHNYNQFSINDVRSALNKLSQELGINLNTARIQNLEFGANLLTPFNPNDFINSLVAHKSNQFNIMDVGQGGNGRQTVQNGKQYGLKVYNKGLQNAERTSDNLLRFEVKCLKMEVIRKGGIYLSDLLHPVIIERCQALLKDAFNDLVISEPVNLKDLSNKEREFVLKCINPIYWNTLSPLKRCRDKKKYSELLEQHSTDRIKEKTFKILTDTLREITTNHKEKCNVLTDIVNALLQRSDHLGKLSIHCITKNHVMYCRSCGRDISTQKSGSLYCSEKVFGQQGKKCRNMGANPRNNLTRKIHYLQSKGVLFDILEYMKIPEGIKLKKDLMTVT